MVGLVMFKYFQDQNRFKDNQHVTAREIELFKKSVISKMVSLGATKEEIDFINDEIVKTSINNNHSPDDLAWAMMQ